MPDYDDMAARHEHLTERNQEEIHRCARAGIAFDPLVEIRAWIDVLLEQQAEILAVVDMTMPAEGHLLASQIRFQEKIKIIIDEAYEKHSKPQIEIPGITAL